MPTVEPKPEGLYPEHASLPIEQLERLLCRELGCAPQLVALEPVLPPFPCCRRCWRILR